MSTARHADTEATTVFVYDGAPGGAGFAAVTYQSIYRRQGCWNPGIAPYTYPYSFSCAWA